MKSLRMMTLCATLGACVVTTYAATSPSRNMSTYVLLGLDSLKMKDFAFTNLGNVGVNNAGGQMMWGRKSFFGDGSQVVTDVLRRTGKQSSLYDLFANTIVSPLSSAGAVVRNDGPLTWAPLPLIASLPPTPACAPGSTGVTVAKGGATTLGPGSYGPVVVANGGTLELTGGVYCFSSLKVARKSHVIVDAAADVTVMGKVICAPGCRIEPATGSGLGATDIEFGVAGAQVKFSGKTYVSGVFYAPNALMRFGRGGFYTGAFVAENIRSDFGDTFTLETCGNGVVDPGEQCDDGDDNGAGASCCSAECDFEPEGKSCADGNLCNGDETCSAFGQCTPGTPPNCNDDNVCTTDDCAPATGCTHVNVPNGTPCPDHDVCNGDEICTGGACTDQANLDCNDHDPCTSDGCNPTNGCVNLPIASPIPGCDCPNGNSDCDDHNVCNGLETCAPSHQFCLPGTPLQCQTTNPCLIADCDETSGCFASQVPPGTTCNDDDACTINDECNGSACGGFVLGCNDGDPCTADGCDPQTGCVHGPIANCTGDTVCTLTQGAYGAGNGAANGPQGWVTNNPGILPASIGAPGTGASVTVNTQAGLIAFMPTNGTPAALDTANGDVVINVAGDVPDPNGGGSNGDGAGTLAGQALAMTLNVALSNLGANPPGLGTFVLTPSFCTCDGNGGIAGPFTISQCILDNAVTVNNLLALANQALRGIPLSGIDPCLTYSDITSALDALNVGYDECRTTCSCTP